MKPIKDYITTFSQHKHWQFQILHKWPDIMGSLVSQTSIYKMYKDSIIIGVSDSCLMQELYLLSNIIKNKINTILGENRIKNIKFHYKSGQKTQQKNASSSQHSPLMKQHTLSDREKKALQKITDPELNEALKNLLHKCHS